MRQLLLTRFVQCRCTCDAGHQCSRSICKNRTSALFSDGGTNSKRKLWQSTGISNFAPVGERKSLRRRRREHPTVGFLQTQASASQNIYCWEAGEVAKGGRRKAEEFHYWISLEPSKHLTMAVGPLVAEIICTFIVAASLLYRYGDWFRHHIIVTLSVLVAWYFSFLIIFILPLDVTSVSLTFHKNMLYS